MSPISGDFYLAKQRQKFLLGKMEEQNILLMTKEFRQNSRS